jgi:hypothetical protein
MKPGSHWELYPGGMNQDHPGLGGITVKVGSRFEMGSRSKKVGSQLPITQIIVLG